MEKEYEFLPWLPEDAQREILKRINDPIEIIKLSQISNQLKKLLKISITKLTSDENPLYLKVGWLSDYAFLELVDDTIVFEIDDDEMIKIPINLKKFNLLYMEDLTHYQKLFNYLLSNLHDDIKNYTIRFIFESEGLADQHPMLLEGIYFAIIIDQGYYYSLLSSKAGIMARQILYKITKDLNSLQLYPHDLTNYFDTAIKTNPSFNNFVVDVSIELNINLFDLMPTYRKTGFILYDRQYDIIFAILSKYIQYKNLSLSPLQPYGFIKVKYDFLIIKYRTELVLEDDLITIDWDERDDSTFYNIDTPLITLITHLRLTDPSIYELLIADYHNIQNLKV